LTDEFKDLVYQMMAYKPSDRLTLKQIEDHPWVNCREEDMVTREEVLQHMTQLKKKTFQQEIRNNTQYFIDGKQNEVQTTDDDF
jgi:serine/threonine protein kinase